MRCVYHRFAAMLGGVTSPNAQMIEYWNANGAERWVAARERIDRGLAAITHELLAFAAPRPGERVLDVGCGCGTTTLELARRTGAPIMGLDVSAPMLRAARARVPDGLAVTFVEGDASVHPVTPSHDLVFSRFGVMFFADPVAAFRHLSEALLPSGRIAFVCWRAIEPNAWASAPLAAARSLLPPQPPVDPHAPGPFAFADADRLRAILARAGLREVQITPLDSTMWMGDTLDEAAAEALRVGPLARAAAELPPEVREQIELRVREAYAPYATASGVALPAAAWLVGAR